MYQYLKLLQKAYSSPPRPDRTGTGVSGFFGHQMRFNLAEGFPLVTTKLVHFRSIVHELLWFLSGDTNIKYLKDNGVSIWDEWADENGDLGPVYGKQWRSWPDVRVLDNTKPEPQRGMGNLMNTHTHVNPTSEDHDHCIMVREIDQIERLIHGLKTNPYGRRHIVSAWNPAEVDDMALPPCHCLFQFHVHEGVLSCQLYQRSADVFLGVPFNIASYALLTHMVAHVCGYKVGDFIWTGGDCHLYDNHREQAFTQLGRTPMPLPTLHLDFGVKDIFDFKFHNIHLEGYSSWPALRAPVAV